MVAGANNRIALEPARQLAKQSITVLAGAPSKANLLMGSPGATLMP